MATPTDNSTNFNHPFNWRIYLPLVHWAATLSHSDIKQKLEVWSVNEVLKESCLQFCEEDGLDESNPAMAIIVKIWKKLKDTHKLRIVD